MASGGKKKSRVPQKPRKASARANANAQPSVQVLSAALRSYREHKDMPQAALARALSISPQNLCDIERGRTWVSPTRAAIWAQKLLQPPWLFVQYALQEYVFRQGLTFVVRVTLEKRKRKKRNAKPT